MDGMDIAAARRVQMIVDVTNIGMDRPQLLANSREIGREWKDTSKERLDEDISLCRYTRRLCQGTHCPAPQRRNQTINVNDDQEQRGRSLESL